MTTTPPYSAPPAGRHALKWLLGALVLLSPCGFAYRSATGDADRLCAMAKVGMPIDVFVHDANAQGISFLDSRKMDHKSGAPQGHLTSITAPSIFRKICVVTFVDRRVSGTRSHFVGD